LSIVETQDVEPSCFEIPGTLLVTPRRLCREVLTPVDFDNEVSFAAAEVQNGRAEWVLTSEF
jgi:hypothetical protein